MCHTNVKRMSGHAGGRKTVQSENRRIGGGGGDAGLRSGSWHIAYLKRRSFFVCTNSPALSL